MAEYIDREALIKSAEKQRVVIKDGTSVAEAMRIQGKAFRKCVETVPTADVVEVRHGYWIHEPPYIAPNGKYLKASECSNCHAIFVSNGNEPYSDHPYCCECGAKMYGERKEQG